MDIKSSAREAPPALPSRKRENEHTEQLPTKFHSAPSRMRRTAGVTVFDTLTANADSDAFDGQAPWMWPRRKASAEGRLNLRDMGEALFTAASELPTDAATDTNTSGRSTPLVAEADEAAEGDAVEDWGLQDLEALVVEEVLEEPPTMTPEEKSMIADGLNLIDSVFGPSVTATLSVDDFRLDDFEVNDLCRDPSPKSVSALFDEVSGPWDVLAPSTPDGDAAAPSAAPNKAAGTAPRGVPLNERNATERKEWSAAEDETIRESVLQHGCKWRRIAALLPGRSDDAVRNRWNRIQMHEAALLPANGSGAVEGMERSLEEAFASEAWGSLPTPPVRGRSEVRKPRGGAGRRGEGAGGSKPERQSWTKAEDATILSSVAEMGHRWGALAERLPGRTEHAIRNRFHRLQTMMADQTTTLIVASPDTLVSEALASEAMLSAPEMEPMIEA